MKRLLSKITVVIYCDENTCKHQKNGCCVSRQGPKIERKFSFEEIGCIGRGERYGVDESGLYCYTYEAKEA